MKIVVIVCLALGLAYCGYLSMLYVAQDGMVFPGRPADPAKVAEIRRYYRSLESFEVAADDGTVLRGYYLPRLRQGRPAPAVLYFAGNAEEQTGFFLWSPNELRPYSVAGLDYRGYGASEGRPSEAALKADALAAYDALAAKLGPDVRIAVMGRSLGTALAAHVAANRAVAGVILVTPYESLAAVGQDSHPLVPVRLLMKHPFDVAPDAARVTRADAHARGRSRPARAAAPCAAAGRGLARPQGRPDRQRSLPRQHQRQSPVLESYPGVPQDLPGGRRRPQTVLTPPARRRGRTARRAPCRNRGAGIDHFIISQEASSANHAPREDACVSTPIVTCSTCSRCLRKGRKTSLKAV